MASNFLKRKAEERAKIIDEQYGEGTYGSTANLKQKLETAKKTSTTEKSSSTKSGGAETEKSKKSKASSFLQKKAVDASLRNARNINHNKQSTEGGKKDSWFKSGGFSDGVDGVGDFFGDLGQTALGTVGDFGLGAVKGIGRMVEGLVDLGTYGVAGVADLFGAEEFAEKTKDVARYSATDEWTKGATDYVDKYSVLGNKADAISEGLGQVLAIMGTGGLAGAAGLGGAGIAAVTTGVTGLSSMGTNMGEAYESNKATDGDAFVYGLTTGIIEAGTELLAGGLGKTVKALGLSRGIGSLDDMFAKKLASKATKAITNEGVQRVLGNTIEASVKAGGEGLEEVLSGFGSAAMKKMTYMRDEDLKKLVEDEQLLEQFVVGTLVSSITQSPSYIKANKTGTDFVTEQTFDQERTIQKLAEQEIAEREANGEELTTREKNKIYSDIADEVMSVAEIAPTSLEQYATNIDKIKYLTDNDYDDYIKSGNQHTQHQKADIVKNGESAILRSKEETDTFIERSLNDSSFHSTRAFSRVSDRMIRDMADKYNVDVDGYYLELNSSDIFHTAKHENEQREHQIPLTEDDLKRLPEYMVNYDDVLKVKKQKDGSVKAWLGKKINGHSIVITIVSKGRQSMTLKTAYLLDTVKYNALFGAKKEDVSHREATASNIDTMPTTPESVPSTKSSSNNIISQDKNIVNDSIRSNGENNSLLVQRLEAQSKNNEPLSVEDVKKATGFGEEGSKLVVRLANREGVTFSQAERAVKIAYNAGFTDLKATKVSFDNNLQKAAFDAGKIDRGVQDRVAKADAKHATIYDGVFTENEHTKNFTKTERKMISIFAEGLAMDISTVDQIIASETIVDGKKIKHYANASHEDGKMQISRDVGRILYRMVMHEGGHRMKQLAPSEFGVLMNALYKRAARRSAESGVSQSLIFDNVKAEHDNAGITMDTSGYFEEFAVRELETIFSSAREFNKWYAEISGNRQLRNSFERFIDWVLEVIDDIKRAFKYSKMSTQEKAEARRVLAELEYIKDLYGKVWRAAENAVAERRSEAQAEISEINPSKNLEIKVNEDYNASVSHSLKSKYNEYNTIGMQWAYSSSTQIGDKKVLYNPYKKKYVLVEATKEDLGFIELKLGTYKQMREVEKIYESNKQRRFFEDERAVDTEIHNFKLGQNNNTRDNVNAGNRGTGIQNADVFKGKPKSNGTTDTQTTDGNLSEAQRDDVHNFEKDTQKVAQGGKRYSIKKISGTDKLYVKADEQVIKSQDPNDWESEIFNYVNKVVRKGRDFIIPMDNEESIKITERTAWKLSDKGNFANDYYMVKGNASGVIDEIISVSKYLRSKPPMKTHSDGFARYGFDYRKAYFMDLDGKYYELQLSVGINEEGREAYNIGQIKQVAVPSKRLKGPKGTTTSNDNVPQKSDSVNTQFMQKTENNSQTSNSVKRNFSLKESINISTKNLEKNKNTGYNEYWKTDLSKSQIKEVEKWLRQEDNPDEKKITDTANWYKGRINGEDLFVVYSTEDANNPTILYEIKGGNAKVELNILTELLEEIENGESNDGKSAYVNWVSGGGWMQKVNNSKNNLGNLGRGQNNQNAGVLQSQPQRNGSPAFWNVLKNLFGRQEQDGKLNKDRDYSLKSGVSATELLDTIDDMRNGKQKAIGILSEYVERGAISSELYEELIEKYGSIPKGEKPHRDIQVPKKTAKDKKVSQTVRTILEAKATPDEALPTIEKMVEEGTFSYDVYTDKQAINDADSYIKEYGWDKSLMDWFSAVEKGVVSKEHTAIGWALYNNAANIAATTTSETERTTAINTSLNILDAMVRHQRSAAQALQATRILKKLSPETQLYGVQKSIQALRKELVDKYGDKAPNLKIDESLAEQYLKAETQKEREAIEKEIYKDIGRQMPSRFIDKWNAVRYVAMLANARTHLRNIVGNAAFAPIVIAKDLTATAIESVVYRVSGKKMVRGKALIVGSKADRELLKAAWSDYANVADIVSNGGKYSDHAMANKYIEEGRKIFKSKTLERVRKTNSDFLEKEDVWFSKPHYAYALAQYCKANNITAEQIKNGKAIRPARVYAIKEAQKATYKDTNEFSQWVSSFGRRGKNNSKVEKIVGPAVEGVLPYRRTPANILVRGVEYSPYGLLKGLSYDLVKVSKGEMTVTEAIDNISAGLTGTGLLALGVFLAAQGLIRGRGEDDEEEREFKELMGHQAYALELPNGESKTLDWLAPEALPFFVGVNIWEATKGSGEKVNLSSILRVISNISEPMLEMSCLQSLNELVEGIRYASDNDMSGITAILASATTSYLTQSIPTLLGQAERTGEENRMTTYIEKNDFLTKGMQYTLGKISSKIPFVEYHQIPYIDAWGRKEASGTALKRGFNNFLNPAYVSTINESDMEKELLRLYEKTGDNGVFPERADKYFIVDGVRKDLTAEEYVRYATLKGEKSYKAVSDLVKSKAYKKLTDQEKAKAVQEAYDYANQKAKQAIGNYKPDSWVKKADEFGSNIGNYISFRTNVSSTKKINGDKISKQEVVDIILDMAQNDSETWKMYLSMYDSDKDMYAYDRGIGGETYMYFLESLNDVDRPTESGKYGTYTQEEAYSAIRQLEGLSQKEKAILWQSVNTSWKASKNPFR